MPEQKMDCPACGKHKLFVNDVKLVGFCQYCKRAFKAADIEELNLLGTDKPQERQHGTERRLPPLISAWDDKAATKYLTDPVSVHGRQIRKADAPRIMYDTQEKRLYIPIHSPAPELQPAWHTRSLGKDGTWRVWPCLKQHYVYCTPTTLIGTNRIVVVEGIFDAIRLGAGAVALLGTRLSEAQLTWLKRFREIMIYMDPDPPGQDSQKEIVERLRSLGKVVVDYKGKLEPGDLTPWDSEILKIQEWLGKEALT